MLPSCTPFIITFIARCHTGALQRCAWLCIDVCSQGFEVDWVSVCMCNICACFSARVHGICWVKSFRMNPTVFMMVFFLCQKNLKVYVDINVLEFFYSKCNTQHALFSFKQWLTILKGWSLGFIMLWDVCGWKGGKPVWATQAAHTKYQGRKPLSELVEWKSSCTFLCCEQQVIANTIMQCWVRGK